MLAARVRLLVLDILGTPRPDGSLFSDPNKNVDTYPSRGA